MKSSSRSSALASALALLAGLLAACTNETIHPDREYTYQIDKVKVVERSPAEVDPGQAVDLEYHWLQAFDRGDIGDEVDLELGGSLLEGQFELRLDDLYLELWHHGAAGARRLMRGLRDCDRNASIRFGKARFVQAGELDPPSEWPCELRYLASDAHGLQAAELLRDHLRTACEGEARELVREIVDRYGLVLRPVAEFAHAEDPENRSPLVLVLAPEMAPTADSDL